jgi:SAM-dependent methyltransferase
VTQAPTELVRTTDAAAIEELGDVLRGAGYTAAAVQEVLASEGAFNRDPSEIPLYLRLLEPVEGPLPALIKLFLLGEPVPEEEAARALAPLPLERLTDLALLLPADGGLVSTVHLSPTEDLLLASDRPDDEVAPADHVLGLSPPTRVLACLTVRRQVDSVFDIGTGFGLQALVAATHADRVVGVDINPRALRFAEFNAILNRIGNVELREGSMFDPVEGERFDLIVGNPPYVISPETEYIYRDSGLAGDSFCEGLVRRLPEYLNEGGFAHALIAWAHDPEEHWAAPVARWVEGSGCDALLFHYVSHDPLGYAAGWNRPLRSNADVYGAALDRWLEYYRELGIEAIAWGAIVLRRRDGDNWFWAHNPAAERIGPASHHILRLVDAQDLLSSLPGDEALLDQPLALADDHRLEQTVVLGGGEGFVYETVLRLEGGIRSRVVVDPNSVQVLSQLDGHRPLREALARVAAEAGTEGGEELEQASVPAIRRLLELGFLVRPGD